MKKLLLTIAVLAITVLCNKVNSQAPNWNWVNSAGSTEHDISNCISTDANGNVFMTGHFESPTITFGTTTLSNSGLSDIFIVKYDTSGNVLWAKSAGGTERDRSNCISTDISGNVFMTGYFESPTITFGTTTLISNGSSDIFIVKYDASGSVIWAKNEGGTSYEEGRSVSTDAVGNIFMAGAFNSPNITIGTTTLTHAGSWDICIVKYDASGNVLWAKSSGGTDYDLISDVATDTSGSVFLTGYFNSPSITFDTTTITNTGSMDIFIVKYDANGNLLWAKSEGGSDYDQSFGVSTDSNGNVFITGKFQSPGITFGTTVLINTGDSKIFIVKYNASGNVLWAKSAGSAFGDEGQSVSTDAFGNVYMIGRFNSPNIIFGTNTLTNAGSFDICIVKYDTSGNVLWAKSEGGVDHDSGTDVCNDAIGNLFITGAFVSPTITFGTTTLTCTGLSDIFIAKLDTAMTTGFAEQSEYSTIVIAPNPFTSQTTISFKEEQKNTTIKIIDVLGKEIKSINFTGRQLILEKGDMPAGIYFVQVLDSKKNVDSRRIVIE